MEDGRYAVGMAWAGDLPAGPGLTDAAASSENRAPKIHTLLAMNTDNPFSSPTAPGSLAELQKLNERSRTIFRQIVESYLATGDPVGSRNLAASDR
jgi:hypothetical protein